MVLWLAKLSLFQLSSLF